MVPSWTDIQKMLAEGRQEEARKALEVHCEGRVQERGGHLEAARLCERLGLFSLAEREYGLALRDEPGQPAALEALASLHEENGRWERAAHCLETLLPAASDPRAVAQRLLALYERGGEAERVQDLRRRCAEKGIPLPRPVPSQEPLPEAAEGPEPVLPTDADLVRFLSCFGGREDVYARQWFNPRDGRSGYAPVREPLTPKVLRQHFLGDITVGVYPIRLDGTCLFAALDLDLTKAALEEARREPQGADQLRSRLRETTTAVSERLRALEMPFLLEDSGYKGHHLWFFPSSPEPAATLHALGRVVLGEIGPLLAPGVSAEWFPKAVRPGAEGLGNLIKLPLGIHRRTGRRSCFLGPAFDPLDRPLAALLATPKLNRKAILALLDTHRLPRPLELAPPAGKPDRPEELPPPVVLAPSPPWTDADFERSLPFRKLLMGCPVLRRLKEKAVEERSLTYEEVVVLTHTFGHMPGGVAALNYLLALCPSVPKSAQLVSPLRGNPASCARIRSRVPHVTSRVPCACSFPDAPDHYPTPLLHLKGLPPAEEPLPQPVRPPEDEIRRWLLLGTRLEELRKEREEVEASLMAALRARAEPLWELPEGTLLLEEKEGVSVLRWRAKEAAP